MNQNKCKNIDESLLKAVNIPIELYESTLGQYFIGYADNLVFGEGTSAWARLYNPIKSGVILHVNVWTVTDVSDSAFRAQFWFNATPPESDVNYAPVTPTNLFIKPQPRAKVRLEYASNVTGEPTGGIKAFVRRAQPETTLVESENGKIIIGEGGNFLVFLSNPETPELLTSGRIAFGFWEEKIKNNCKCND
ncbi:DUF6143 family protein [Clostridium estertheticum]|uniref:DUF6143 family protein n=1 Tax=Clostridium estertheticum TaxID=238834 RepID=UPI001C0DB019|nr:DUF6143 family protein [Clostridium estertheticum]MBU3215247.1 hypothetical protein [Clostridium estertheticum]WAG56881.1 DUF6143 family protein [Clostridium estertheticum]